MEFKWNINEKVLTTTVEDESNHLDKVLKDNYVIVSEVTPFISSKLYGSILHNDSVRFPFLISKSNIQAQISINQLIKKSLYNVLFIVGDTGVGKTHFIEYNIQKILLKGTGTFYIKAIDLINFLKRYFSEEKIFDFIDKVSCIFIDDIQMLNNESYSVFFNSFFNLLDLWLKTKRVIITSDVPHTFLKIFPERILNRFTSGIVANIDFPDECMKMVFIKVFCEKNNFTALLDEKSVMDSLLQKKTLREIKAMLKQYLLMYEMYGYLSVDFVKSAYLLSTTSSISKIKKNIDSMKILLREFFGVSDFPKEAKRKNRTQAMIDSIIFYVFSDFSQVTPHGIKQVRNYLNIQSKHEKYFYEKGKNAFKELPNDIQIALKKIAG